ncbi:hypothetical protein HAX54_045624 [Datura stramonium]|uniref:Uncharacterized protein n=1 Tax=Datura stramonium TaxID=4076 RepID=A0ABS8RRJ9_DATST|nr:hypothetical protein [Datura stramonium]
MNAILPSSSAFIFGVLKDCSHRVHLLKCAESSGSRMELDSGISETEGKFSMKRSFKCRSANSRVLNGSMGPGMIMPKSDGHIATAGCEGSVPNDSDDELGPNGNCEIRANGGEQILFNNLNF